MMQEINPIQYPVTEKEAKLACDFLEEQIPSYNWQVHTYLNDSNLCCVSIWANVGKHGSTDMGNKLTTLFPELQEIKYCYDKYYVNFRDEFLMLRLANKHLQLIVNKDTKLNLQAPPEKGRSPLSRPLLTFFIPHKIKPLEGYPITPLQDSLLSGGVGFDENALSHP